MGPTQGRAIDLLRADAVVPCAQVRAQWVQQPSRARRTDELGDVAIAALVVVFIAGINGGFIRPFLGFLSGHRVRSTGVIRAGLGSVD